MPNYRMPLFKKGRANGVSERQTKTTDSREPSDSRYVFRMVDDGPSETPSFSRLVFGRAISDTVRFLGYTRRDLALGAIALILGAGCAYVFVGKADTVSELASIAAFTLAPGGIILFGVFVWHLWLAPSVLAYEAAQAILLRPPAIAELRYTEPSRPAINWEPWKKRANYRLTEFAKILAKLEPSGSTDEESDGYLPLLKEDAMQGRLRYQRMPHTESYQTPDLWPYSFSVTRDDAMAWAKAKGFDLSHIT